MNDIVTNSISLPPLGESPDSLAAQARSPDARSHERIAADFEGLVVSLVLKEMRQTLEPGTMFGDDASDSFGGIFDLYLGKHVAAAGGFGVANMVKRYLEVARNNEPDADANTKLTR